MSEFRVAFLCLAACLLACGEPREGSEPERAPIEVGGRPCPEDNILTWENFGEPFLLSQCTGCHSSHLGDGDRQDAPIGVDFDTYDLVREWGSRIYFRAGTSVGGMPPAGGPCDSTEEEDCDPDYDRVNLADWLACDAPTEADLEN